MSKKIVFVTLVLAFFCFAALTGCSSPTSEIGRQGSNPTKDALNGTYNVDNTSIELTDGRSEIELAPGAASKLITTVWEQPVAGDVNGDKIDDAALLLIQDGGGSGTFYYLVANIAEKDGKDVGTDAIFLGDRISPKSISIKDGGIVVNYLNRKADEPMSASPTVEKTKTFKVTDHSLTEM